MRWERWGRGVGGRSADEVLQPDLFTSLQMTGLSVIEVLHVDLGLP